MKLDAVDLRSVDTIQRDGRITKLALAERAGLSPTPCWVRLRSSKAIEAYWRFSYASFSADKEVALENMESRRHA